MQQMYSIPCHPRKYRTTKYEYSHKPKSGHHKIHFQIKRQATNQLSQNSCASPFDESHMLSDYVQEKIQTLMSEITFNKLPNCY